MCAIKECISSQEKIKKVRDYFEKIDIIIKP